MITVYISIGNSDDKLTQKEWSGFCCDTWLAVQEYATTVHGNWYSPPGGPYQNACACVEVHEGVAPTLKKVLGKLAAKYRQDSIAWAEAQTTFIGPAT